LVQSLLRPRARFLPAGRGRPAATGTAARSVRRRGRPKPWARSRRCRPCRPRGAAGAVPDPACGPRGAALLQWARSAAKAARARASAASARPGALVWPL